MPEIRGLKVFAAGRDQLEELTSRSSRYRCVKAILEASLALLETPTGKASLVDVATKLVRSRNTASKVANQHHLYRGSLNEMPTFIDEFLRVMRRSFPNVTLQNIPGEAEVSKYDFGDDISNFRPQSALDLVLHGVIIDNMLFASQQNTEHGRRTYKFFKFQMIISVAHEIIHCLTHYLTGRQRLHTPPSMKVPGYCAPRAQIGESGRYWETRYLGGCVEMYFNSADPLKERQSGTPYLVENGEKHAVARLVSLNYIDRIFAGDFDFPIATSAGAQPTTRNNLGISNEMTFKRPGAKTTPPTASRGNSPGVTQYRTAPVETAPTSSRWGWSR